MEPDDEGPWGPRNPPPEPPPRRRTSGAGRWLIRLAIMGALGGAIFFLASRFPGLDDQGWARVGYCALLLVAVSARVFTSGPVNWPRTARHAAIWVGLVAVIALGFSYRGELLGVFQRVRGELIPAYAQQGEAHQLVITQSAGGYQVMGEVNGQPVRFIVDTGATETVLSPEDAHRAGLNTAGLSFDSLAETANGTGRGARVTAARLSVGGIEFTDMPVVVNQAPMSVSLLGMSFLRRLDSFEVRGGRLYLRPKP